MIFITLKKPKQGGSNEIFFKIFVNTVGFLVLHPLYIVYYVNEYESGTYKVAWKDYIII